MKFFTLTVLLTVFFLTCLSQAPTITSFTTGINPSGSAATGTTVTINGTNFSGATAVSFGGTPAASFTIVSAAKITAVVGTGTSGNVSVTTPAGTASKTGFYYLTLSAIITDYNGFWSSTTASVNNTKTNSSHNLLAFTYNGTTYATGADNSLLDANGVTYANGSFRSLPVAGISGNTSATSSSTYIALAQDIDGSSSAAVASEVSDFTIKTSLTDGLNGLDLGTGVTNLPTAAILKFSIFNIVTSKIADTEPDILITQIADPSSGNDIFQFTDVNGNAVGNSVTQDMTLLSPLGNYLCDLFNLTPSTPYNNASVYTANAVSNPKQIRMTAFKLSDFGITAGNASTVKFLKITPSSNSDYAFIAYNANSLNLPPSISQNDASTNASVCAAGIANLDVIATAASGGVLSYSWERSTDGGVTWVTVTNGGNVSGAATNKLSITAPANNDQYRATVTEAGSGLSSTSPVFTIAIVSPAAPSAVNITISSTCVSTPVIITSTVTGGSNLYYQWQSNASGSYTDIPDANLSNYVPPVNTPGTISYRLNVSSGNGCTPVTSAAKSVTVSPASVGGSISGGATVCSGTNSTALTLSGSTGSVVKWQSSTDNFATATDIANTTTNLTATDLTTTTKYRAVVKSGACTSVNSSVATVTVNASVGGDVNGSTSVCSGTNSTTLTLSGKTGNVLKWQSSTDNFATDINDIVNTTSSLTATNLTATTEYRAVVQYGSCNADYSNSATITINVSIGGTIDGSTAVCSGTNSTALTLNGNTGSVVKWQSSTDDFTTDINDIANTTSSLTTTNLTATTEYRVVVQNGSCAATYSSTATITVNSSVGGIVNGSTTVCFGTNSTALTLNGNIGTVVKWQSSIDNFVNNINDIANTGSTLTATDLTTTTQYRVVIQNGSCSAAYSADATITINPQSVGGTIMNAGRECAPPNDRTLTLAAYTGNILKWQSSTDNFETVTDITNTTNTYTAVDVPVSTRYRVIVKSGVCPADTSSVARIRLVTTGEWVGASSGDWNVVSNWCGGIPPANADILVPAFITIRIQSADVTGHSVTIEENGHLVMENGYNLNIQDGGSFINNGSLDASASTGAVVFQGTGTISGNTIFKNIETNGTLDFGTGSTVAGNFTIQPGGSVTSNSPAYICPSSNLIYNTGGVYSRGLEWSSASSGTGYPSNVTVQNNTTINYPVAGDGYICNDLTIGAGSALYQDYSAGNALLTVGRNVTINGTLSLGSGFNGDIRVGGNWTRNTGGVFNNNQRAVIFNGSGNSVITAPFSAARDINGAFGGETFYDLHVDKSNVNANVSLASNISILNEIGFSAGVFDLMNSDVTMVSNAVSTAHISSLPISSGEVTDVSMQYSGTGKFVIQRYLNIGTNPSSRRWRLLTVPLEITDAPTINEAWQEGVSNADKNNPVNPWPGFGTTITKSNIYNPSDGYDQGSRNNSSLLYFSGTGWDAPPSTYIPITDHDGYMLFARGSRDIVVSTPNVNADPTTLEPKGRIRIGDIEKPLSTGFQTIGNPYASAINFSKAAFNNYTSSGTTYNTTPDSPDGDGITYYIWDPETDGSSGVGKFITCSSNGDGTYLVTANTGNVPEDGTIPSGTAFMIAADNSSGSLTFHEADKLDASGQIISRPLPSATLASKFISKLYAGTGTNAKLADAVINSYADYNNAVDGQDALSFSTFNNSEALSISRTGADLSIERRSKIMANDTIFLSLKNLNAITYELHFKPQNFDPSISAVLEDKFTGTSMPLSTTDSTVVSFNITDDKSSSATDRFRIIFRPLATLPVTFENIKAIQKNNDIVVKWEIEDQVNIIKYEIEKSNDGSNFIKVNITIANQQSTYTWLDEHALAGDNYYRIKYIDANGSYAYSKIVKIIFKNNKPYVSIYPNPVTDGNLTLQLNDLPAGKYNLRLLDKSGKLIIKRLIEHAGGTSSQALILSQKLINGSYELELTGPDKKRRSIPVIVHQ